jgi:glycosyltransferase involved in cell wall biosynthesis
MRIMLATERLGRDGGTAAHVVDSAITLHRAGHSVTVLTGDPGSEHFDFDVCVIQDLNNGPLEPATLETVIRQLRAVEVDVVHVHGLRDPRLASIVKAAAPLVWSVHNYIACTAGLKYFRSGAECFRPHGPGCLPNIVFRGCDHRRLPRPRLGLYREINSLLNALRSIDATVVYSDFMREHLLTNHVDRVFTLPLFVDPPALVKPAPRKNRLLFSGRLVPYKGLDVLMRALRHVPDASLEVCGEGWGMKRAIEKAARLGVTERISFLGWQTASAMKDAYDRSDVVVVPSLWPEPFGLVGLEAMGRGRPVIGSDTGGVREWLHDGETGYLVPPGHDQELATAIRTLISEPQTAHRMGQQAMEIVSRQFSSKVFLQKTIDLYRQVVEQRERGAWSARTGGPHPAQDAALPARASPAPFSQGGGN